MSVANMALKNLSRQMRRSVLLGGAIAFGILVITVVNGLSGSLISSLETNISNLVPGHIFIQATEKTDKGRVIMSIQDDKRLQEAVTKLKVPYKHISKTTTVPNVALISDFATSYLSLTGADLRHGSYLHDRMVLVKGSLDDFENSNQIMISEKVATKLNVQINDRISVQAETITGQQNVVDFLVGAIYKDPGVAASLAGAYAPIEKVNELRNMLPGAYSNFGIFLEDVAQADFWGAKIYTELQNQKLSLWPRSTPQELNKTLRNESWKGVKYNLFTLNDALSFIKGIFQALNGIAFMVLMVLFIVIMVGITNTYRMIVYERTREIGTLRALGMQRPQIRNLFLLEALFLAIAGILAGFLVGVLILFGLSFLDLSAWKDFNILLKDNHLKLNVDFLWFLFNLVSVSLLTVLAALFPARRAGKLTPAEALRTTN